VKRFPYNVIFIKEK